MKNVILFGGTSEKWPSRGSESIIDSFDNALDARNYIDARKDLQLQWWEIVSLKVQRVLCSWTKSKGLEDGRYGVSVLLFAGASDGTPGGGFSEFIGQFVTPKVARVVVKELADLIPRMTWAELVDTRNKTRVALWTRENGWLNMDKHRDVPIQRAIQEGMK